MTESIDPIPQRSEDVRVALDELDRRLNRPTGQPKGQAEGAAAASGPPPESARREFQTPAQRLAQALWNLDHLAHPSAYEVIESRRPVLGPAIVWGQRIVRRLTGWYLVPLVHRIQLFQDEVVAALRALAGGESDPIETGQILSRLNRLEQLVQVLRLSGADLPAQPALGTRAVVSRQPTGFDYLAFEDRFRGSVEQIRERQAPLVAEFRDAPGAILDLGCGRGEFLTLLREAGLDAYGIDESPELVERGRAAGLDVFRDDALTHLAGLPDKHLGGIFASHLIEHLSSDDLWSLFRLTAAKLRSGGVLVIESPNPATLTVSATTFWIDPTHRRPVHPDTARFLLEQVGFVDLKVWSQMPFPPADRLPPVAVADGAEPGLAQVERALNELIDRLNDLIYGDRDYLIAARRGPAAGADERARG